MKQLFLIFLVAITTDLSAQIQKGSAVLGGTIGLSKEFDVSPILGGFSTIGLPSVVA